MRCPLCDSEELEFIRVESKKIIFFCSKCTREIKVKIQRPRYLPLRVNQLKKRKNK